MGTIAKTLCILMILIVLSETIVLEGRRLKDAKSVIKRRSTLSRRGDKEVEAKLVASFLEDFRPTTPGHSPGIGHMMRNKLISSIGKKVK